MNRAAVLLIIGGGLILPGCMPQARFVTAECTPEVEEGELQAVNFRSSFNTLNLDQQQLIYEVAVLDPLDRPIRAETGRYKDKAGNLKAVRTVIVLQNPASFENLQMSIPAAELSAANKQKPAFAEFRVSTTEGQMLAAQRVALPAPYAANVPAAEPPVREERVASARKTEARPPVGEPKPGASPPETTRAPASSSGKEVARNPGAAKGTTSPTARASTSPPPARASESEQAKPARRGEPPPLRPVGRSTGPTPGETARRPTGTATKPPEPRERVMAGDKDNVAPAASKPATAKRPASSQPKSTTKPAASQPTTRPARPTRESEITRQTQPDGRSSDDPDGKKDKQGKP
jgi:hypothetical protein